MQDSAPSQPIIPPVYKKPQPSLQEAHSLGLPENLVREGAPNCDFSFNPLIIVQAGALRHYIVKQFFHSLDQRRSFALFTRQNGFTFKYEDQPRICLNQPS